MRWNRPDAAPSIMGIINVTPDSFSDGGRYRDVSQALGLARRMIDGGADILDVGGESTRPGARPVPVDEQVARVVPVVRALRRHLGDNPVISVDTTRSEVAERALGAGANMINDVSAGRDSPGMFRLAAAHAVPLVIMHMQGRPETMQTAPHYDDVLDEVEGFLRERMRAALDAGVATHHIILDPGIGFGKRSSDNLALLAGLHRLVAIGPPVLLGASRKRFMGRLCGTVDPVDLLGATCATTAIGATAGVRLFRVHDVKENRQAANVAWALRQPPGQAPAD